MRIYYYSTNDRHCQGEENAKEHNKTRDFLQTQIIPACTAAGGGEKALPPHLLTELQEVWDGPIIVALDGDAKGRKAAPTLVDQLRAAGYTAHAVNLGPDLDLADYCRLYQAEALAALVAAPELTPATVMTPQAEAVGDIRMSRDEAVLLNALNRTDVGNAEALAALYGDELRYCHSRKKWLAWAGSRWQIDEDGRAERSMISVTRRRYIAAAALTELEARKRVANWALGSENSGKIEAALRCAGRLEAFTSTIGRYDANPMLAATPTATLDLHIGTARPPARGDFLTMALGTSYDPAADCPRWRSFLDEVFDGDTELVGYLQRAVGYCLTGDTSEQKVFLCYGGGANGKSTFLEVLTWLLGDYSANAAFDTFDAGRRSDATNDLAALKGRRLVTVIETEEDRRLAEARVKAVTGGDLVTARFLYGEFFSYRPQFKIWLAMNHKPVIRGTDRGIWRRLQLIPFTRNFEGREDRMLRATLRAELSGVLNWALEGLRAWHAQGLGASAAVTRATREYQEESDQVGRWMGDCCMVGKRQSESAEQAYKDYTIWCEGAGEKPLSQNLWGRRLTERGFVRERQSVLGRQHWRWIGFGLIEKRAPNVPGGAVLG